MRERWLQQMLGVLLLAGCILLIQPSSAMAGGWVIVTLDELPGTVIANEPISVGFTVRQHGQTLVNLGLPGPTIAARNRLTDETVSVAAHHDDFLGHYRAEVTFPQAGLWTWQIEPNPFGSIAQMPPLLVMPSTTVPSSAPVVDQTVWWLSWLYTQVEEHVSLSPSPDDRADSANLAAIQRGRDLFLAKGCGSCHHHQAVHPAWTTQSGPDLTFYDKTMPFLALWLADPAAVKPATEMPTLELNAAEIEALSLFLVGNKGLGIKNWE